MKCYLSRNYKGVSSSGYKAKTDMEDLMAGWGFRNVGLKRTFSPRHHIICTDTFWSIESISLFKKRRHTLPAISPKEVFQLHLQRRPFQRLQDSDTHTRLGFFPSQKALSFPRNKETGTCRLYHRDQSRHAAMDKRPTLPDACRPSGSMGLFIGSAAGRTQGVAIPPTRLYMPEHSADEKMPSFTHGEKR